MGMKAVKATLLYDGLGNVLRNVYVVFDKDIVDVTREKPKEAEIVAEGVVMPAFIDGHSHIGMDRYGEPYQEGEANEQMDAVLPLVDALYSIYMDDKAFKHSIEFGVLYSSVLPGSGNDRSGGLEEIDTVYSEKFEEVVQTRGVAHAILYDRVESFELLPGENIALDSFEFGSYIETVGGYGVYLSVVRYHPEGLGRSPLGECVRGESLVEEAEGDFEILVLQVLVELFDVRRHHQTFVGDDAAGEGGYIELLALFHRILYLSSG